MEHSTIVNNELGQAYFYFESKNGRLFVASQVTKELGYKRNSYDVLKSNNLIENDDFIKFHKKDDNDLFRELIHMNVCQLRTASIIMLTESGFWKLVMQSQKSIGIKTRHWLANEVLPSIRKTGNYNIATGNPMEIFTERKIQLDMSKAVNSLISQGDKDYAKFWNDLHLLVVGMDAKSIKDLYKTKESAKEVLRKHAPHLEATEAVIADLWNKGIGLKKIEETDLHKSLAHSFKAILSLGIDLKQLGK